MYFQVCSNSVYLQHSGERYRTNVLWDVCIVSSSYRNLPSHQTVSVLPKGIGNSACLSCIVSSVYRNLPSHQTVSVLPKSIGNSPACLVLCPILIEIYRAIKLSLYYLKVQEIVLPVLYCVQFL